MVTSANDRLERLFANKPRPAKPDAGGAFPSRDEHRRPQSDRSTTDVINAPECQSWVSQSTDQGVLADSDDSDDYVAAFSRRPKKKSGPIRSRSKPEPGASAYSRDTHAETMQHIEFVPEGNECATKMKRAENLQSGGNEGFVANSNSEQSSTAQFCPLSLVAKFPYKYMKDSIDRVSKRFFASNKFYDRQWHLYYLHPPESFNKGPLVLLPVTEVQKLLDEISSAFKIRVKLPPFPFTIDFFDDGTPKPVLLGTSTSRQDVNDLTENIPEAQPDHGECPHSGSTVLSQAYEAYHDKIEQAMLAGKGKGSASLQNKAKKTFQAVQVTRNQVKRAERYFGLRPCTKAAEPATGLPWEDEKVYKHSQLEAYGLFLSFLDVSKPAKYPFEHEPVIISIDVESYERNHALITEIGISTLDTLDLVDLSPGPAGENWMKQIRSRHFRIKDRQHLVNKDFCVGNPDAFQFGRSDFVSLIEASEAVDSCFEWPFSVQFKKEGPSAPICDTNIDIEPTTIDLSTMQKGPKERNLLLLGHDTGTDLDYLQKLGSGIFNPSSTGSTSQENLKSSTRHRVISSILEILDTAIMYKALRNEPQPRSLAHICHDVGIDAWFLHNGGNDARYTLEALIKLVIQARLNEDEQQLARDPTSEGIVEDEWQAEKDRLIDDSVNRARKRVQEQLVAGNPASSEVLNLMSSNDSKATWSLPLRSRNPQPQKQTKKDKEP